MYSMKQMEDDMCDDDCCDCFEGSLFAKVGEPAPMFEAEAYTNGEFKNIHLKDYKGKWVVLFFYPLDFTFVCPTEVTGFNSVLADFEKENAVVLGCSVDSVHSHKAWTKEIGEIKYPLISDITKDISLSYNVLVPDEGIALRGLFIINPEGVVKYQVVHDMNVGRNVEEVLRVLQALKSGGLCPVNWKKGEKTL